MIGGFAETALVAPPVDISRAQIGRRVEAATCHSGSPWSSTIFVLRSNRSFCSFCPPFLICITLINRRLIYRPEYNHVSGEISVLSCESISYTVVYQDSFISSCCFCQTCS